MENNPDVVSHLIKVGYEKLVAKENDNRLLNPQIASTLALDGVSKWLVARLSAARRIRPT